MNINYYYYIYLILILIILYLIYNIKEPFIIGSKYTFSNAIADSIAWDVYQKKYNKTNYLSLRKVSDNVNRIINKTKTYSNLRRGGKIETLSNELKRLFLGPDKRLRNRAINVTTMRTAIRKQQNYENYLKQITSENNNINNNSENINKYRKIAELRLANKKAGVLKEFQKLGNLEKQVNILQNVKIKTLKQRKKQLEQKNSLSKKEKKELSKINTKISKSGSEINETRIKINKKKLDLENAKQKAKNSRIKYNDKQKRKKEIVPKILKSTSKKALKLVKKRVSVK